MKENITPFCESSPDVPELYAHDLEFLPIVAQRLVAKCGTSVRNAVLEVVVEP